ncbi:hypothetical protein FF38_04479 [Lucilia cuprina]|uniref:Uncharacterized protein n=1 Tax=Lucilia cuprina TaxID=7375 RepID=A0A0L0CAV9_LUCCU|nr:hypothetical protein FF38_04479 [Lucilia cuprina]
MFMGTVAERSRRTSSVIVGVMGKTRIPQHSNRFNIHITLTHFQRLVSHSLLCVVSRQQQRTYPEDFTVRLSFNFVEREAPTGACYFAEISTLMFLQSRDNLEGTTHGQLPEGLVLADKLFEHDDTTTGEELPDQERGISAKFSTSGPTTRWTNKMTSSMMLPQQAKNHQIKREGFPQISKTAPDEFSTSGITTRWTNKFVYICISCHKQQCSSGAPRDVIGSPKYPANATGSSCMSR